MKNEGLKKERLMEALQIKRKTDPMIGPREAWVALVAL